MRNVFEEYRQGILRWDAAFAIANNSAATATEHTDYWADQMDSLAVDAACRIMDMLGYKQNQNGEYFKIDITKD